MTMFVSSRVMSSAGPLPEPVCASFALGGFGCPGLFSLSFREVSHV